MLPGGHGDGLDINKIKIPPVPGAVWLSSTGSGQHSYGGVSRSGDVWM